MQTDYTPKPVPKSGIGGGGGMAELNVVKSSAYISEKGNSIYCVCKQTKPPNLFQKPAWGAEIKSDSRIECFEMLGLYIGKGDRYWSTEALPGNILPGLFPLGSIFSSAVY